MIAEGGVCLQACDWVCGRTVQIRAMVSGDDDRSVHTFPQVFIPNRNMHNHDDQGAILGVHPVGGHLIVFRSRYIKLVSISQFSDTDGRTCSAGPAFYRFRLNDPDHDLRGVSLSEPLPNLESPNDPLIVYAIAYQ